MSAMASQITSLTIVYSSVYSGTDQRNVKTPRHWPLWGEFTVDRWIPRPKGQLRGKCFHLMASSWWEFNYEQTIRLSTRPLVGYTSIINLWPGNAMDNAGHRSLLAFEPHTCVFTTNWLNTGSPNLRHLKSIATSLKVFLQQNWYQLSARQLCRHWWHRRLS